jgi:hypothetical protein
MADTIGLYRLLGTYRSERQRHPAEPPLDTAAHVLAWAGDRLDRDGADELVIWGRSALARDGIGRELRRSPQTVTRLAREELLGDPPADRPGLLSVGLVEYERDCRPWLALRADLAAGRRSLRDLTRAEYAELQTTDTTEWTALLIWFGGWIPIGIVAIVASVVVAVVAGDGRLFLLTAIGGTIVGYAVAIGAITTYLELDTRWLRRGQQERAAWVILLSVGPAVALLLAVLFLGHGLGLDFALVLDRAPDDVRGLAYISVVVLALRAIAEHDRDNRRQQPPDA